MNYHDNVPNHINEDTTNLNYHDNVPNASNIEDVGIDEHLVPHLDIYDLRNWGNLNNKVWVPWLLAQHPHSKGQTDQSPQEAQISPHEHGSGSRPEVQLVGYPTNSKGVMTRTK